MSPWHIESSRERGRDGSNNVHWVIDGFSSFDAVVDDHSFSLNEDVCCNRFDDVAGSQTVVGWYGWFPSEMAAALQLVLLT